MAKQAAPVGIDLGTTFSVISYLDASRQPRSILNAEGDLTTPSVVLFENGEAIVGMEAVKAATIKPNDIAQFVKREMGSAAFSKTFDGASYPPEVIQAHILRKLRRDAEATLGPISDVVIAVPAYFQEPRRQSTIDAGRIAGFERVTIINEPTAAAIAYGIQQKLLTVASTAKQTERVLIYDLGGGTFDVTVMTISGGRYDVDATDGEVQLGGIDWDHQIADYLAEQFLSKHGLDPRDDPAGWQRLMRDAEDAKRALSARQSVTISCEHHGQGLRVPLTRELFCELTENLLERTRYAVNNVLREADLKWSDIARVLLVGGSTRMPMVAEMLERDSGKSVDRSLSPDESVAHGAAIYAGLIAAKEYGTDLVHDISVTNVNSHDLGVLAKDPETGRDRRAILIPKNTPLPVTRQKTFRLVRAGQTHVSATILEGGDDSGNYATPIGQCVVSDLPEGLTQDTRVIVEFRYEPDGRLQVNTSIPGVNLKASIEIKRESGMSETDLARWSGDPAPSTGSSETRTADGPPQSAATQGAALDVEASSPPSASLLNEASLAALHRQQYDECIMKANQLLSLPETNVNDRSLAFLNMGEAYYHKQRHDDAIGALEQAMELNAESADSLSLLAICYFETQRHDEARTMAQRCLAINPEDETSQQILSK